MPLKITDPVTQVASLNRWADWVESQLKHTQTHIAATNKTGVTTAQAVTVIQNTPPPTGGAIPGYTVVPTVAGTIGNLAVVTNGGLGDTLYAYVGTEVGLPVVANRGTVFSGATGPVNVSVPMQRAVVANNLLVACCFCSSGAAYQPTLGSGWTQLLKDTVNQPFGFLAYRVADGSEGTSVSPFTGYQTYIGGLTDGNWVWAVEVSNVASVSPILSTTNLTTVSVTLTAALNDLVLAFVFCAGPGPASFPPITGAQNLGLMTFRSSPNNAIGYSWPLTKEVTGNSTTKVRLWPDPSFNNAYAVVISNGPNTVNWWRPIG